MERLRATLPELPRARAGPLQRRARPAARQDAARAGGRAGALADFFDAAREAARGAGAEAAKKAANWLIGEVARLRERDRARRSAPRASRRPALAEVLALLEQGTLNGAGAKVVVEEVFRTGAAPAGDRAGAAAWPRSPTRGPSRRWWTQVLAAAPAEVERHRSGKKDLTGFFVGQVMKALKGKGNPGGGQRAPQEEAGRRDDGLGGMGRRARPGPARPAARARASSGGLAVGSAVVTVVLALERSPPALLTGVATAYFGLRATRPLRPAGRPT